MTTELDPGAVPGDSTKNTFCLLYSRSNRLINWECIFDGVEIESTGRIEEWSYRDVSAVPRTKTIIANENFALAA